MAIRINHKDNSLQFNKVAAPLVNPPAGTVALYFDSTGTLAFKDEAGTESEITSTASDFVGYFETVAKIQATTDGVKALGQLELTGYVTGSLPTGVEGAVVYDTTTNTLKYFNGSVWTDPIDSTRVLKTGDTMTGNLVIHQTGPSPVLYIRPGSAGNGGQVVFQDVSGIIRAAIFSNEANGQLRIKQNDNVGAEQTSLTFSIDGNVSVNGLEPSNIAHLTRKDYVDDNFVDMRQFATQTVVSNFEISNSAPELFLTRSTEENGAAIRLGAGNDGFSGSGSISTGAYSSLLSITSFHGGVRFKADTFGSAHTLDLDTSGGVTVSGAQNQSINALTRKDYVDNFYQSINGSAQTDLDLVLSHGVYNFGAWLNLPSGAGAAGSLTVAARDNDDTTAKTQTYVDSSNKLFFRYGSGATFAWQAWKEVFTTDGGTMTSSLVMLDAELVVNSTVLDKPTLRLQVDSLTKAKLSYEAATTRTELLSGTGQYFFNDNGQLSLPDVAPSTGTAIRKDYVDTTTVALDGSRTITGDLLIGDGTSGNSLFVRADASSNVHVWLRDSTNVSIGLLYADTANGNVKLRRYAANGSTVETDLTLLNNGNVSVNGLTPSDDAHLTRKDYVDDNFLPVYPRTPTLDLNDLKDAQTIGLDSESSSFNYPVGASYGTMIVTKSSNDSSNQLVFGRNTNSDRMWTRGWNGATWAAWTELATTDNVDTLHANRNVIINGNFDIWQRGSVFAAIANTDYSADRFSYNKVGTMVHTAVRSGTVPTQAQSGTKSNYSFALDCTTADATIAVGDFCVVNYKIEGYDYARLAGEDATLSFWVQGAKTGIHCVAFRNSGADRSYIMEYTIETANVWQKVELTIPLTETGVWDYTNNIGLSIGFALACGTTFHTTKDAWQTGNYLSTSSQVNEVDSTVNNFYIAQVQLERGNTATPFEFKSAADEMLRCHRYYWRGEMSDDAGYRYGAAGNTLAIAGSKHLHMRATSVTSVVNNPGLVNCSAVSTTSNQHYGMVVRVTVTASGQYRAVDGIYDADAEL